jgi:hypothetical protein
MSFEPLMEYYKISRVKAAINEQFVVENDIIVPDYKPDVASILVADGDACGLAATVTSGNVTVSGRILYKILYRADGAGEKLKSMNVWADFNQSFESPDCLYGMIPHLTCGVIHVEHNIINSRKISLRAIIKCSGPIKEESDCGLVCGVADAPDLQYRTDYGSISVLRAGEEITLNFSEAYELPTGKPSILEILRYDLHINEREHTITGNELKWKGVKNALILYTGDDTETKTEKLEFEHAFDRVVRLDGVGKVNGVGVSAGVGVCVGDRVDVTGKIGGMGKADGCSDCEVLYTVESHNMETATDDDGELRVIKWGLDLKVSVEAYQDKDVEYISDAFSPKNRFVYECAQVELENTVAEVNENMSIRERLELEDGYSGIALVYNVICDPEITEYEIMKNKIDISGVAHCKMIYQDEKSEIVSYAQSVPFRHIAEAAGADCSGGDAVSGAYGSGGDADCGVAVSQMSCNISARTEYCSFTPISAREIEIRPMIKLTGRVTRKTKLQVIGNPSDFVEASGVGKMNPSLVIYITQPGDTLWGIAKKYFTTVSEITKINEITDADILAGSHQILIPKWSEQ